MSSSAPGLKIESLRASPCTNALHYIIDNKLGMCEGSLSGWCISCVSDFYDASSKYQISSENLLVNLSLHTEASNTAYNTLRQRDLP